MRYDVVISLGEWCIASMVLRMCDLQNRSFPFDWSGGRFWDKCGHGGLSGKVDLICNNFENFFNLEDFESLGPNPKDEDYWFLWVVNNRTGLQYKHDFPSDVDIKDSYSKVRDKYCRRVDRLYDLINKADKILFVYIAISGGFSDDYLKEQQAKLQNKFPKKRIDFLYFFDDRNASLTDVNVVYLNKNVRKVTLNYRKKDGESNNVIMSNPVFIQQLNNISLSGFLDAYNLREDLERTNFASINNKFIEAEDRAQMLYVLAHKLNFEFLRLRFALMMFLTRGRKQEKYKLKHSVVTDTLKRAKAYQKELKTMMYK